MTAMSLLDPIADKVAASDPLTEEEIEQVSASHDVIAIGAMADRMRRTKHDDVATFVRVQTIPVSSGQRPVEVLSGAHELRLIGDPENVNAAVALTARLAEAADRVPVTGFELNQLARLCGGEAELVDLLTDLSAAGLAMLSEVRADDERCWEWVECAARAGLRVARLGLGARVGSDNVRELRRIAAAGAAAEPVRTLAPLAFRPEMPPTTGLLDVRRVALARLLVDNIDSIQVDWGRDGPKLAQVALAFGADDVDAVSADDESEHGWRRSPLEEIKRNIRAASLVPSQRDGRFDRLDV